MGSPTRFEVFVRITHEPNDCGPPRPLAEPFVAAFDRGTREEAAALVDQLFAAAAESGVEAYLTAEIRPVRAPSPVAGEILPGGGGIVGEGLGDVLDLDTWSETRFVTTRTTRRRRGEPGGSTP